MRIVVWTVALLIASFAAQARGRTPCSGAKGGVSHCLGSYFVCRDGTTSQSKRFCTGPDASAEEPTHQAGGTRRARR